ncbi:MAG: ABC transporter permease subunit [Ilumatobacteraceae bacterium]
MTITDAPGRAAQRLGRVLTYRRFAVISLLFPPTGVPALVRSLQAGQQAKRGEVEKARLNGQKARDWAWYSVGIGMLVYAVAFIVYLLMVKNGAVRRVNFSWHYLWYADVWRSLWGGFKINLRVFAISAVIVLIWALAVAIIRMLPGRQCAPIRFLVTAYCDLFRAVPAILVIGIVGFGIPKADPPFLGGRSSEFYAISALVLVYGAYVSEVYRAGIESIHWSQTAASRSLGLTYGQSMRHVVVPQAVRRVVLPLMNDMVALQKDTSLIYILGGLDVINKARFFNNSRATFTGYTIAAIMFAAISLPLTRLLDYYTKREQRRKTAGA